MLTINNVETYYGNIRALKGVSLTVPEGSTVTLLGANGAGKSTTLKTISGLVPAASGTIEFMHQRIDRLAPERIVRLGISHVPEGREGLPEVGMFATRTPRRPNPIGVAAPRLARNGSTN